jgi:hypothetical protein
MKLQAHQLAQIKKLPIGYYQVTIVQITDQSLFDGDSEIEYIDVVFHGADGFIVSSFFNTKQGIEKLILLFRVCGIDTPIQYSLNTCLLTYQELIIHIEEVSDMYGEIKTEVVGMFAIPYCNEDNLQYQLPEGISYKHYKNNEEDYYEGKFMERMLVLDQKYYHLYR